jgi:hypothetical protein
MNDSRALKLLLKRGALIAAANWPLVIVQFTADALVKTLLVVPLVGGVALVALVVEGDPSEWLSFDFRTMVPALINGLMAQPVALAAFLGALAIIAAGGSVIMFAVKAGTLTILVAGEHAAGSIERPPLNASALSRAGRWSLERFVDGTRRLFPRYLLLGCALAAAYLVVVGVYAWLVFGSREQAADGAVVVTAASIALVGVITLVNFVYLLMQIVMAAEDCGPAVVSARVMRLLKREFRAMAGVLAAILALMILTTAASVLATAALGLIAFVPFVGLAALPLQIVAWAIRGLVFQYISLAGAASYLRLYRLSAARSVTESVESSAGQEEVRV